MRTVGYRQVWQFLEGEISEAQMREQAVAATRQLAKRQLTWLRSFRELEPAENLAHSFL
jgi:tRNA dimethylallyltransferase